ncbi:MAG: hypothetical protein JW395_3158 [Nitrospira sp.]|nr:hypothetical protein [Nitrospira sp.]
MVEFAFVLPALALMVFAVADFSRLLLMYVSVANGAREGARQGVVYPTCLDSGGSTSASIQAKVRSGTDTVITWDRVTPVITYWNGSVTPTPITTPVVGGLVKVEVSVPYDPITPLAGPIIGNPSISSSSMMIVDQLFACQTSTPTVTATVSPTPTTAPTLTPTVGPSSTPTPTPPPGATPTFTPTRTATPTATACTLPAAPVLSSVTRSGSTHTITWAAASGASTYNVYRDGAASNPVVSGVTGVSTTHSQTGTHNHVYYVAGVHICGTGPFSNQVTEP